MIKTTKIILDSFLISSEIELTDAFIKGAERVFRDSFEYKKLLAYYGPYKLLLFSSILSYKFFLCN